MKPMRFTAALAAGAIFALSVGLGGCVTLFPKTKPAQLYSFGSRIGVAPPSPDAAQTQPVGMLRVTYDFPRAADKDQILTRAGDGDAYISGALWIAPASVLFREAAERDFESANPPIRLLQGADNGIANMTLRLEDWSIRSRITLLTLAILAPLAGILGGLLEGRTDGRDPGAHPAVPHRRQGSAARGTF